VDEFKISAKEYYKEQNEFLLGKTTKWIEKYFKNNNFDVINNEGGGDCLFCIIRDGLETVGIKKQIKNYLKIIELSMKCINQQLK
jgi:hypothetical protein